MVYFARKLARKNKHSNSDTDERNGSIQQYGTDHVLHLQRTIGNKATQALLNQPLVQRDLDDEIEETGEEGQENDFDAMQGILDNIEQNSLPNLKKAFKTGDVQTAYSEMGQLIQHPLLVSPGTIQKLISLNFRAITSGNADKMAMIKIYNRFYSLSRKLAKLVRQYRKDRRFATVIALYNATQAKLGKRAAFSSFIGNVRGFSAKETKKYDKRTKLTTEQAKTRYGL